MINFFARQFLQFYFSGKNFASALFIKLTLSVKKGAGVGYE